MSKPVMTSTMKEKITPIKLIDELGVHRFIFKIWQEFFNATSIDEVIQKRKDIQHPHDFYTTHGGNFWCLKEDTTFIATIAVHEILFEKAKVGFLRRFYIDKNYRNRGLGVELLNFIEDFCKRKKWRYLMFGVDESMERNKSFYLRNGYEEFYKDIPQEILDDNDTWYLRKQLRP